MKTETKIKLEQVKNLGEYLEVLKTSFNCVECKPGNFVKATLIFTLMKKLNITDASIINKVKNMVLQSKNISEFTEILKNNFDCNLPFSNSKNIVADTQMLLSLLTLREN